MDSNDKRCIFFRINNGNLIQFGASHLETVSISTTRMIAAEEALNAGVEYVSNNLSSLIEIPGPVELKVIVIEAEGDGYQFGDSYTGFAGKGYSHRLIYSMLLEEKTSGAVFRCSIDANTAQILVFEDYLKFGLVDDWNLNDRDQSFNHLVSLRLAPI